MSAEYRDYPNTKDARARNKKRNAEIIRLREMGWSYKKIGLALNVPVTTASGVVNRQITSLREALDASERLSPAQLERALRRWADGQDTWAIAQALEVSEPVVFNSLRAERERVRKERLAS